MIWGSDICISRLRNETNKVNQTGPGCTNRHVPEFMQHPKLKEAEGGVYVVAVNDPFV